MDVPGTGIWHVKLCMDVPGTGIWHVKLCVDVPGTGIWHVKLCVDTLLPGRRNVDFDMVIPMPGCCLGCIHEKGNLLNH
jgi:hypothetical protein